MSLAAVTGSPIYVSDEIMEKAGQDVPQELAAEQPILRELIKKDAITVKHKVDRDNLHATTVYMGMLGDPHLGGRTEKDFRTRMKRHAKGEIRATLDIAQEYEGTGSGLHQPDQVLQHYLL